MCALCTVLLLSMDEALSTVKVSLSELTLIGVVTVTHNFAR